MLDNLSVYLWMHDENYSIIYANRAFKEEFGPYKNQKCYQCLMGEKDICSCCLFKKPLKNIEPDRCKVCKRKNSGYDLSIFQNLIINQKGQKFTLTSSLHIENPGYPGPHAENSFPKT